jgi:tRNA modification GTPase
LSSALALAKASSPHGYQSTGLDLCCNRYGLVALASLFSFCDAAVSLMDHLNDTIFALASAPGRAGVAVWRVSGPAAAVIFKTLLRIAVPEPRLAVRAYLRGDSDEIVDDGLALWFPAPHSFTGEDVAELHLHGGMAALAAAQHALASVPGFRLAEPGEFTRRAFENGKMDLTEAEGLADLVDAETEAQRRQARRQMNGELGDLYEHWRAGLISALAHFEAEIDFAEEDIPPDLHARVVDEVRAIGAEIAAHLDDRRRGEILRSGVSVAIVGPPNAGKSSLLNRLARREAAIVSETAGTTRDVIEVHLDLAGFPVVLADTAGLRVSSDAIEREGVRRAQARADAADLKLAVFDGATWPAFDAATQALVDGNTICVVNKSDLGAKVTAPFIAVSAKTGVGLDALEAALSDAVRARFQPSAAPALTRARHRSALLDTQSAFARFLSASEAKGPELAAEDLRLAARSLGRITGRVDVEEILGAIFAEFCIGK